MQSDTFTFFMYEIVDATLHSVMTTPLEPKQQSPLPVWKKFIAIAVVALIIVILKSTLQGFMTVSPMMTTSYLLQDHIGLVPALMASWVVYLLVLPLFIIPLWKKYDTQNRTGPVEELAVKAD